MTALIDKFLNNPVFAVAVLQSAALLFINVTPIAAGVVAVLEVVKRQLVAPAWERNVE